MVLSFCLLSNTNAKHICPDKIKSKYYENNGAPQLSDVTVIKTISTGNDVVGVDLNFNIGISNINGTYIPLYDRKTNKDVAYNDTLLRNAVSAISSGNYDRNGTGTHRVCEL